LANVLVLDALYFPNVFHVNYPDTVIYLSYRAVKFPVYGSKYSNLNIINFVFLNNFV